MYKFFQGPQGQGYSPMINVKPALQELAPLPDDTQVLLEKISVPNTHNNELKYISDQVPENWVEMTVFDSGASRKTKTFCKEALLSELQIDFEQMRSFLQRTDLDARLQRNIPLMEKLASELGRHIRRLDQYHSDTRVHSFNTSILEKCVDAYAASEGLVKRHYLNLFRQMTGCDDLNCSTSPEEMKQLLQPVARTHSPKQLLDRINQKRKNLTPPSSPIEEPCDTFLLFGPDNHMQKIRAMIQREIKAGNCVWHKLNEIIADIENCKEATLEMSPADIQKKLQLIGLRATACRDGFLEESRNNDMPLHEPIRLTFS